MSNQEAPARAFQAALDALSNQQHALARQLFLALVKRYPRHAPSKLGLADALFRTGEHASARFHAGQALALCSGDEALAVKAIDAMIRTGDHTAVDTLKSLCDQNPSWALARSTLGGFYSGDDRLDEAAAVLNEALALHPESYSTQDALARVYAQQGRCDEALALFRKLAWSYPDDQNAQEGLTFFLNSAPGTTPLEVYQAHVRLGRLFAGQAADVRYEHPATDDPGRTLNIGFVTHDFNAHSVSFFLEPLLRNLDRAKCRVSVYFTNANTDATTEVLRQCVDDYHHLPSITSLALAERVHRDRVDVLVDLNGWTAGHRLHAFQLKPAPVQVSYLGYPNTTGIPAMDYRIVDSITDPPGADGLATETLLRLDPCFLCYTPITLRTQYVPSGWQPPRRAPLGGRPVVFGSFNNASKITDQALSLWGRVLRGVEGSRLMVKARGMRQEGARRAFAERLERAGIDAGRVVTAPQTPSTTDHLSLYSAVDICLDTFPYNGTTTTCEGLLMGVPHVTMLGDRHSSRVGASLLSAVGLESLIARTSEEYVDLAAALASDTARLRTLHENLPSMLLDSPLCRPVEFARRFESLIREAWRVRCESGVRRGSQSA